MFRSWVFRRYSPACFVSAVLSIYLEVYKPDAPISFVHVCLIGTGNFRQSHSLCAEAKPGQACCVNNGGPFLKC